MSGKEWKQEINGEKGSLYICMDEFCFLFLNNQLLVIIIKPLSQITTKHWELAQMQQMRS